MRVRLRDKRFGRNSDVWKSSIDSLGFIVILIVSDLLINQQGQCASLTAGMAFRVASSPFVGSCFVDPCSAMFEIWSFISWCMFDTRTELVVAFPDGFFALLFSLLEGFLCSLLPIRFLMHPRRPV